MKRAGGSFGLHRGRGRAEVLCPTLSGSRFPNLSGNWSSDLSDGRDLSHSGPRDPTVDAPVSRGRTGVWVARPRGTHLQQTWQRDSRRHPEGLVSGRG